MREMIISELSQAVHEIARAFAHFLPRLIVMLILAFVGWVIAYVVKAVLRSILRLIKFDKLSENDGASQLLTTAAPGDTSEIANSLEMLHADVLFTARKGTFGHGMSVGGAWELTAQHLGMAKGKLFPMALTEGEL